MEEEIVEQPVIETEEAAELEESAPSEEIEETEDFGEEDAPAEPPKSKGVQKRIDELVRQREEERRRADRLEEFILSQKQPSQESKPPKAPQFPDLPPVPPDRYSFDSDEDYGKAVQQFQQDNAKFVQGQIHRAQQESRTQYEKTQRQQKVSQGLSGLVQKGSEKHADFQQVAFVPTGLEDVFLAAENGPEIAYYLGQNPQETQRLLNGSPAQAAFEIAKLDAKLSKKPNPTKAPPPISPVGGREPVNFDPNTCTADEYRAWRQKQRKG